MTTVIRRQRKLLSTFLPSLVSMFIACCLPMYSVAAAVRVSKYKDYWLYIFTFKTLLFVLSNRHLTPSEEALLRVSLGLAFSVFELSVLSKLSLWVLFAMLLFYSVHLQGLIDVTEAIRPLEQSYRGDAKNRHWSLIHRVIQTLIDYLRKV